MFSGSASGRGCWACRVTKRPARRGRDRQSQQMRPGEWIPRPAPHSTSDWPRAEQGAGMIRWPKLRQQSYPRDSPSSIGKKFNHAQYLRDGSTTKLAVAIELGLDGGVVIEPRIANCISRTLL